MAYPLARLWLLPLLRRRLRSVVGTEHIPRHKPCIAVANHNGWLDSAYIVAVLAKYTGKKIFLLASSHKHRWLGAIPINRENTEETLRVLANKLKRNHPIIIFPEGKSNSESGLRKGKTGAARVALKTKVPVVPIGIRGTRYSNMYRAVWHFLSQKPIDLSVGQPVVLSKYYERIVDHQLLDDMTGDIMVALSKLSGKPVQYD